MFIALYMLDYNKQIKDTASLTYSELKISHNLIEEDIVYEFMNETFSSDSCLIDSFEYKKILCFTIGHSKEIIRFINELDDSIINSSEKKHMIGKISGESFLWDNSKLRNFWVLTPNDLNKIHNSVNTDYWDEFQRTFGNYGKHQYSKPIFNSSYSFAVIEHSGQGGWELGSGEIMAFVKIRGKWTFYSKKSLWIS
ncbi:hypothetical protein CDL62_15300 [Alkalitalea saponilacus]|nr:hypothetical protein CDL62_14615 [Alkalitalea saponilacus]ASB50415.1 hypothetical protein CDL62_15300 [Alkalitalea saponilacus]